MGEGSLKSKFEEKVKELGISVEFIGRLPYSEMIRHMTVILQLTQSCME